MSTKGSNGMYHDSVLPVDEQEHHDLFVTNPKRVRTMYQLVCKRRFFTSGFSVLHQIFFAVLFTVTVYVAYGQGLRHSASGYKKSFVPHIGPASGPVVFTDSADWSGNTSRAAVGWNRWLKNFDTHTISIPYASIREFSYEPGLPDTDDSQRFGISMFHQLHCLATIREFAYLPDAQRMPNGKPLDHDGVQFSPFHMDHCFNYLRQSVECFADSTVEWAKYNERGERQGIQGWGIPHNECRDRNALEAFALQHHGTIV